MERLDPAREPIDRLRVEWAARYLRRRRTQEFMSRLSGWWHRLARRVGR